MKSVSALFQGLIKEQYSEFESRYIGFGKELFTELKVRKPEIFEHLVFYSSPKQPSDSFAFFERGTKSLGIQLDPETPTIVLWNEVRQTEIGDWASNPVSQAITYIERELLSE